MVIDQFIFTQKKGCFQISSDMDIFINETIVKWQSKLKLNFCIHWTSNFEFYNGIAKKILGETEDRERVAACLSGINLVYLDTASHQFSFAELEKSIVHELLHLKYPDESESWIIKKTNGVLK